MGEMIKFGIKIGMTIAASVALMAAITIIFTVISNLTTTVQSNSGTTAIRDVFGIISTVLPFNFFPLIAIITSFFTFKISYWAASKMLWLIDVLG